ncbi:MAG: type II secretion system F family protein [Clostridia bacterium]|nr:type II secretion system F family protein [Clostridia bacterium]
MIKYLFSTFLLIITFINTSDVLLSIILFVLFYFLPNLLIKMSLKAESIKIINDISNIVQNLVLSLSANMPLYDSLKGSTHSIQNKRFKEEYALFVDHYRMYHFNMLKAVGEFNQKFSFYELNMFLSILIQGEREGNLLEMLENFIDTLDLVYFKYLKYKAGQRSMVIIFSTLISVANSFMIVLYPIVVQIMQNFTNIFK